MRKVLTSLLVTGLLSLVPVGSADAAPRRAAFWARNGFVWSGFAQIEDGRVRLTPIRGTNGELARAAIQGEVAYVAYAPDARAVAWFDTGVGIFQAFGGGAPYLGQYEMRPAPADEVVDRGAWLWKASGKARPGPHAMLDAAGGATPPERWVLGGPADVDDPDAPARPARFMRGSRNVSRYVTAVTPHPSAPRALVAMTPYSIETTTCEPPECDPAETTKRRTRRASWLGWVDAKLRIVERIRTFGGATSLALSAGGTRIAFVTPGGRVVVRAMRGWSTIASYPANRGDTVSFSPDGHLAIGGPGESKVYDDAGRALRLPDGVSWLRFGPCDGANCRNRP